ncbi:MAG: glycosyltransferase family 2 protein, partial [Candidatus Coatesbacteria bacterium]|nr:glycosyltransferase family 2 protein [Candidatus Coatesbacteria bacterium]
IESVGLFDPAFFLYFEDQDICLRLRERGFKVLLCPDARVEHASGVSAAREVKKTVFESYRSLCYFFYLHKSKDSMLALRLAIALGAAIRLVLFSIRRLCGGGDLARDRIAAYRCVISECVINWQRSDHVRDF